MVGWSRRSGFLAVLSAMLFVGADWPRFRGPDGTGISSGKNAPLTWNAKENVVWKTALPGYGASSPIVFGDKVFVTCYSGYGLDQDQPGEAKNLQFHLLAIDRAKGKILWDKTQEPRAPEQEYRGFLALHGYASSTPVSDGRAVYAFFGRTGVFAFTMAGEPMWRASVGDGTHAWGSAASPIVWKNLVIVNASVESESVVALHKDNGKEIWRTSRIRETRGTPLVVDLPDGRQELVVSSRGRVLGLDPATGARLWECEGVQDYICPSVVAHQGIIYITAGRKPRTLAVRAGGKGDVTRTHILWDLDKSPKVGTPLFHEGHLYWAGHQGMVLCVKADTGKVVYEQKLDVRGRGDRVYASLIAAGNKFYAVTRQEGIFVLAAGPEFAELAHNELEDSSIFNATPAIVDGRLLIRSDRYLYCLGR